MLTLEEYLGANYPAIYHLVVTGKCNAKCEGCVNTLIYGERINFSNLWDSEVEANLKALKSLIQVHNHSTPIYVAFYGGEPLLEPEKIDFYLKNLSNGFVRQNLKFVLFTNGMLIDSIIQNKSEILEKLSLLIISIDGQKEQHERVRRGTRLDKIEQNLALFKTNFSIPILMWSTIRENMSLFDCVEEFLKLYNQSICDYFFWHLIESETPIEEFQQFRVNYVRDLEKINDLFVDFLQNGKILPILPLCEIYFFLIKGIRRGHTGCSVERLRNFDVVAGKVLPCVDLGDEIAIDDINDLEKYKKILDKIVDYKDILGCKICPSEFYCGGRCPVLVKVSPHRARQYCTLMRDFVKIAKNRVELVERALRNINLRVEELYFPYGYLVLLTDVVP